MHCLCAPGRILHFPHDVAMALAPMFHANSHGLRMLLSCWAGKLVLPGRQVDAQSILNFSSEQVTFATPCNGLASGWRPWRRKKNRPMRLAAGFRGFSRDRCLISGAQTGQAWHPAHTSLGYDETTPVAVCSTLNRTCANGRKTNRPRRVPRAAPTFHGGARGQ